MFCHLVRSEKVSPGRKSLENGLFCVKVIYLGVVRVAGSRVNFSLIESRVVKFVVLCEMSLMISA